MAAAAAKETAEVKRWNLRKRRGDCEDSFIELGFGFFEEKVNTSSIRSTFISTLTKKEVEDDMMMMMGKAPPRRPKKRPRAVQKKINVCPNSSSSLILIQFFEF